MIGSLIQRKSPVIVGGGKPVHDTQAAAAACFVSAGAYVVMALLCTWQSHLNRRWARQQMADGHDIDFVDAGGVNGGGEEGGGAGGRQQ